MTPPPGTTAEATLQINHNTIQSAMMVKDWTRIHTDHCVKQATFCQTAKALYAAATQLEVHEDAAFSRQQQEQLQHISISTDEMLTTLSQNHQCTIISPSSCSSLIQSLQKHSLDCNRPLFVLRSWPTSTLPESSPKEESLVKLFASSLQISQQKQKSNHDENAETARIRIRQDMIYAASCIISLQIMTIYHQSSSQSDPQIHLESLSGSNNSAAAAGSSQEGGRVLSISKRLWNRASQAVTSVMASYDLVDLDHRHAQHVRGGGYRDDDGEGDFDQDDANYLYNDTDDEGNIFDVGGGGQEDVDDATTIHKRHDGNLKSKSVGRCLRPKDDSQVDIQDVIWNSSLFAFCWRAILDHATTVIQTKKANGDHDGLTTTTSSSSSMQEKAGTGIDSTSTVTTGLILNRYGDDVLSFCSFCHEVGSNLLQKLQQKDDSTDCNPTDDPDLDPAAKKAVARLLQRLTPDTTALEILVQTLLTTFKAKLFSRYDILILYPSAKPITDLGLLVTTRRNNTAEIGDQDENNKVEEVDIAVFKISNAIQTLERRMGRLQSQADSAYHKALQAKQQSKNTNTALLHLKRRQQYLHEIEKCSGSILNLEGGLHTIQRAKNDVEVMKTYQLMNASMKAIREESGLLDVGVVEDVMNDLLEHGDDLKEVHENLAEVGVCSHSNNVVEHYELEQELMALMERNDYKADVSKGEDGNNDDGLEDAAEEDQGSINAGKEQLADHEERKNSITA